MICLIWEKSLIKNQLTEGEVSVKTTPRNSIDKLNEMTGNRDVTKEYREYQDIILDHETEQSH
jgi:hypothetical protein